MVAHPIDTIVQPMLAGLDMQLHEFLLFFGTLGGTGLFGIFGRGIGPVISALFMEIRELYEESFRGYLAGIGERQTDVQSHRQQYG